jgi:AraC family transcriptional regulator
MAASVKSKIWKPTSRNQIFVAGMKFMHGGPQEMCLPEHEHPEVQIGVHFVSVQRHGKTPVANDSPAYFSLIPSGKPHAGGWADGSEVVVTLLPKLQVEYAAGELLRSSCSEIVGTSCAVDPIILSMGTTLRNEFLGGGLEDPLFVESVGTVLTGHVVRHWSSRPSQRSMKGQLSPYQLRRTLDAIESWMPSGIRVSALADQLGMGTHQFTRLFRQTMECSPYRFVSLRRIKRARVLLQETSLPLVQIALELGFVSQSHFTAAFHRAVRATPAAYRAASRRSAIYSHHMGLQSN